MILAAGSCLATLTLLFGVLAIANRKQLKAWLEGFIADVRTQ